MVKVHWYLGFLMCGIAGFNFNDRHLVREMGYVIRHRGPDEEAVFVDDSVSLSMQRLSIIDLKKGIYPVHNEENTIFLIFNGEIYNYKQLMEDLIKKGHKFKTN